MKNLYLIGGTMGVGKTTVCRELKILLPNSVFLDGDWCWDMDPFVVNDETKAMVLDNICCLLNNFLKCSHLENIVFCWVMHQQDIIDEILSRLELTDCRAIPISLTCTEDALRQRLRKDIAAGLRREDILQRSPQRLTNYDILNTTRLDTTGKTPAQIAQWIQKLGEHEKENHNEEIYCIGPGHPSGERAYAAVRMQQADGGPDLFL